MILYVSVRDVASNAIAASWPFRAHPCGPAVVRIVRRLQDVGDGRNRLHRLDLDFHLVGQKCGPTAIRVIVRASFSGHRTCGVLVIQCASVSLD